MRVLSTLCIILRIVVALLCFAAALFTALVTAVLAAAGIGSYAALGFVVTLILMSGGAYWAAVHKPLAPG